MQRFSVTGPLGPEAVDYGIVIADAPLNALARVHADGFGGRGFAYVIKGPLVFCHAEYQRRSPAHGL
jgi:hypothetical protein